MASPLARIQNQSFTDPPPAIVLHKVTVIGVASDNLSYCVRTVISQMEGEDVGVTIEKRQISRPG